MARSTTADARSLVLLFVGVLVASAVLGLGLTWLIHDVDKERIEQGLSGVATTGGIISGLSLNGTAVLALSGRYKKAVLDRFGTAVRLVLFGGFAVLVSTALAAALSVVWIDEFWPRIVLGISVPLMLGILISTAALISSAFKWEGAASPKKRTSPYVVPGD